MTDDSLDPQEELDLIAGPSNAVGPRSVIDVKGLAPEVLRLSRLRLHHYEIANQLNAMIPDLNLSHDAVTRWLKRFDSLSLAEKNRIDQASIYDLAQRVQDVAVRIDQVLHRAADKQVRLTARKLIRKQLQFVTKITDDLENMKRDEQVRAGMIEILDRIRPGAKLAIQKKLMEGDYLGAPDPISPRPEHPTLDASTGEIVPTNAPGPKSTIDKLGLGKDILKMVRAGRTQQEIGDSLGLSREQVNRWLSRYQKMSPDERLMVEERSIYNVVDRLEENFQGLLEELEDPEAQEDDNFILGVLGEMLENMKFVQGTVSRLERLRADDRFQEIFLTVLNDFQPGDRAAAIGALNSYRRDQANVRVSG